MDETVKDRPRQLIPTRSVFNSGAGAETLYQIVILRDDQIEKIAQAVVDALAHRDDLADVARNGK